MAQASRRRRRGERAQSIIEFAIAAPFLIFLVLALMEVGNGINSYLTVIAAARDAARLGSQQGNTQLTLFNLIEKETARLPSDLPTDPASENCTSTGQGVCILGLNNAGTWVSTECSQAGKHCLEVRVCYDHPMILGTPLLQGPIHMCSKTRMRINDGS